MCRQGNHVFAAVELQTRSVLVLRNTCVSVTPAQSFPNLQLCTCVYTVKVVPQDQSPFIAI